MPSSLFCVCDFCLSSGLSFHSGVIRTDSLVHPCFVIPQIVVVFGFGFGFLFCFVSLFGLIVLMMIDR